MVCTTVTVAIQHSDTVAAADPAMFFPQSLVSLASRDECAYYIVTNVSIM